LAMTSLGYFALGAGLVAWPVSNRGERLRFLSRTGRLEPGQGDSAMPSRASWTGLAVVIAAVLTAVAAVVSRDAGDTAACAIAILIALGAVVRVGRSTMRDRAARHDRDGVHLLLSVLVAELEAGTATDVAIAAAVNAAPAHGDELVALAQGRSPSSSSSSSRSLRAVAAGWSFAAVTGAPLAEVLARVRDDVDAERALDRGVRTAVAGAQSSALLLAALPLLGLGLGLALGTHPLTILFRRPVGHVLLVCGVTLDVLGVVWISAMVQRARPGGSR